MIDINSLTKSFGTGSNKLEVLKGIDMSLKRGELVALMGPSGCGKSTLLRCICGLESLDSGTVRLNEIDITNFEAEDRGIGLIFQRPVLYPHLSVSGNLSLASKSGHEEALEEVGLSGFEGRAVENLSGGEGQRVALARALLAEPDVLLLDEPFSALDSDLSVRLLKDVRQLLKKRKCPAILVTHNQQEAEMFSDRILEMSD